MLPPRIVRRLVFAPLVILISVAAIVLSPVLLLLAIVTAPTQVRRRRTLRLVRFGLAWLAMETAALVACLGLWIASGFGGRLRTETSLERHYGLVRWFLATLFRLALRIFHLRVEIEEPPATAEEMAARLTRPVIVLSRHAGPGDSFLLVHHLLSLYRRRPRIVMKAALQFDPSLDVVINRLPHAFVWPRRAPIAPPATAPPATAPPATAPPATASATGEPDGRTGEPPSGVIAEIRRLASGLGPTGALVIFPEGGNFTPSRWRRGIRRLEDSKRHEEARRARAMAHLLPPRSGGAFAAIDAAPTADVIFVAHTGLDDLITIGDVWRSLPMEQVIKARWWRVPASEVPRARGAGIRPAVPGTRAGARSSRRGRRVAIARASHGHGPDARALFGCDVALSDANPTVSRQAAHTCGAWSRPAGPALRSLARWKEENPDRSAIFLLTGTTYNKLQILRWLAHDRRRATSISMPCFAPRSRISIGRCGSPHWWSGHGCGRKLLVAAVRLRLPDDTADGVNVDERRMLRTIQLCAIELLRGADVPPPPESPPHTKAAMRAHLLRSLVGVPVHHRRRRSCSSPR